MRVSASRIEVAIRLWDVERINARKTAEGAVMRSLIIAFILIALTLSGCVLPQLPEGPGNPFPGGQFPCEDGGDSSGLGPMGDDLPRVPLAWSSGLAPTMGKDEFRVFELVAAMLIDIILLVAEVPAGEPFYFTRKVLDAMD